VKVLHLYSGNLFGGVETLLVTLARHGGLVPEMEPHFGLCFGGRLTEELAGAGVPVHLLGEVRVRKPWTVAGARRRLRDLLLEIDFDVVVCHSAWPHALFAPVVRSTSLPLVFWMHDATEGRHWYERWARRYPPDRVICNSHFTAGKLPNLFPGAGWEMIRCPVPAPPAGRGEGVRLSIRRELATSSEDVVIVQASRMDAGKGHRFHLEALRHFRDLPGWTSWIVGGAQRKDEISYQRELERIVVENGLRERVRFVGQRSDVPRILAAADIHFQPNLRPEAFGIAFVEALYAGVPVVTTAMGAATEIVDSTCGILVEPGDIAGMVVALRRLLENSALRVVLGGAGPERARQLCCPEKRLEELHSALLRLASASPARLPS